MNKNLLIGLIVVVIIIGGFVMVQNSSNNQAVNTTRDIQEAPDGSDAMMESESMEGDEAMDGMESDDSMLADQENVVTLTSAGFSPQSITISVGEEVIWVNESGGRATVDSSVHPTHRDHPFLNLGVFEVGEQHNLVFEEVGTYRYHDHLNASRFGTVVVE